MRILHVTPTYVPAWRYGGPIRSVHGLCAGLVRQGAEVDVFTTSVDGPDDVPVPAGGLSVIAGVKVRYFRSPWLRRLYFSPAMGRALEHDAGRYDLVHLHSVFLWPTAAAARAARRHGVPYVLSPRGMLVRDLIRRKSTMAKSAWIALVERRNLEHAAAVHATSEAEAAALREFGFRLPRVLVVPNGVDRSGPEGNGLPPAAAGIFSGGGPVVLFVGRVNWKKGLDRLIRALAQVPGASLLVAGNDEEGHAQALVRVARETGVQDRVVFCGAVDGDAKRELYRRATLLALTSHSENFGNVVLEAMAEGCPVLVTPEVGAAAIVVEAGAGRVVDGAPQAIAAGLRDLLGDEARRAAMGRAGAARVAADFSWDSVAQRMLRGYGELLSSQRAGRAP